MLLRTSLGKFLAPAATLALLGVFGGGCGGCDGSELVCDDNGNNCQICDAYGCHDANPQPSSGAGNQGNQGNQGSGGSTPTSSGEGGSGATASNGSGGAGGEAACDQEVTTCPCKDSDECTVSGDSCVGGLCIPGCDFSYQCGPAKVCDNGACVAECSDAAPCTQAGYKCEKGACVPDPQNPECSAAAPCPSGICVDGFCTTACATDADCQVGEICNASTGACIADPSPKPVCADSSQCTGTGQQCGADGYCHYPCTTVAQCKLIADQFTACDVVCKTAEEVDPQCSLTKPCPMGQDCISNQCL